MTPQPLYLAEPLEPRTLLSDSPNPISLDMLDNFGGTPFAIATAGHYAYLGNGATLEILDVSTPSNPTPVGRLVLPGLVVNIALSGHLAYIADHSAGLQIVDISDPAAPKRLGEYRAPQSAMDEDQYAMDVDVAGSMVYLAMRNLVIVDASDPTAPKPVGDYVVPRFARSVGVAAGFAYIGDVLGTIDVLDISNPASPSRISTIRPGYPNDIDIVHGMAYIASESHDLVVYDVSDPATPTRWSIYDLPHDDYTFGLTIADNMVYVAASRGLQILRIDTYCIRWCSTLPIAASSNQVRVADGFAYVATERGLEIVDIRGPYAPNHVSTYNKNIATTTALKVVNDTAYVLDSSIGLHIIDISNPTSIKHLGQFPTGGSPTSLDVADGIAYVLGGSPGFQIIDIRNPAMPMLLSSFEVGNTSYRYDYHIQVVGKRAYVKVRDLPMRIFDVSNPATPILLGSYPISGDRFKIVGNLAYSTHYGFGITDISDPTAPVPLGSLDSAGGNTDIDVDGNLACVLEMDDLVDNKVKIIDISNPAAPVLRSVYNSLYWVRAVRLIGNLAYVVEDFSRIEILDLSNPSAPVRVGGDGVGGIGSDIDVVGEYIYTTFFMGGLYVLHATPSQQLLVSPQTSLQLDSDRNLFSLALADSATVRLTPGSHSILRTHRLSLSPSSTLDIADNTLIVSGSDLPTLTAFVQSTRLTSSSAQTIPNTSLGLLPTPTGILIKSTLTGDATLDGLINADDYFQIDSAYITQEQGWHHGDFNYDGIINADDYLLIDSAYIAQFSLLSDSPFPRFPDSSSPLPS